MKLLWLSTTHMGLESIMGSLKRALWLNVSSMNQEPAVTGGERFGKDNGFEFIPYRYDEGKEAQYHYDGEVDHNILRKIREIKPQVIIYSGPAAGKCRPQNRTLLELKDSATSIGYILDGGCPDWHPVLEEYKSENLFHLTVNTDGNPNWPHKDTDITMWQPVDEAFYPVNNTVLKEIFFGFAGGAGSKHRQDAIAYLKKEAGLVLAERYEQWGTYNKFSDFMTKLRMTINFPETGSGKTFHLKNRVIEAGFARCCLFEKKNPITPFYFEPGVDYIEYEDLGEVVEWMKRITPAEVDGYAERLHNKAVTLYSAEKFWGRIFSAINQ